MSNDSESPLGANNPLKTRRILPEDLDIPIASHRETGPLDAGLGAPWVVEFRVHQTPLTFRLEVKKQMVIGRADAGAQILPDIDLTPYGGIEKGVSRQHAVILAESDRILLMDLDSTNGTYLNEQRLLPHQLYRVRHGDDILVGEVRIEVRFDIVPIHHAIIKGQPWVRMDHSQRTGSGQRVILVENNANISTTLATIITRLGFDVKVVRDMAEEFYMVTRRMPDVIVINLDVNNVNGLELCRYIQRVAHREYVPLIIISEETEEAHISEIMNSGADIFLGKPLGINELTRAIATVTAENFASTIDTPNDITP